jgi:hypothetical protein
MLVAKMAGADDPPRLILDLQHREAGETHGRPRVAQKILPLGLDTGNGCEAEPVVVHERAAERREPLGNSGALAREILANDLDDAVHAPLVFLREAPRHLLAETEREESDRDQHDERKCEQEPRAQAHGFSGLPAPASSSPPSHSAVAPERPRRTTAVSRVSTRGTIV